MKKHCLPSIIRRSETEVMTARRVEAAEMRFKGYICGIIMCEDREDLTAGVRMGLGERPRMILTA